MNFGWNELCDLVVSVASEKFAGSEFSRAQLMQAVEETLREKKLWTAQDEEPMQGARGGTKGYANIDYAISHLKKIGKLVNPRRNRWYVEALSCSTVEALDVDTPPRRIKAVVSRIIRDTPTARRLKQLYSFRCQVCGQQIELEAGRYYIEVHHLRPLGGNHRGSDHETNMMVLCPNHHAMFDYGTPSFVSRNTVEIGGKEFELTQEHHIAQENIDYYSSLRIRGSGGT